jgi:large subunit ribosomal protein L18
MGSVDIKRQARIKRKRRIRKKMAGTPDRPRLSVFRSARHVYAQIVDDSRGETVVAASSVEKAVRGHAPFENKVALATHIGELIAQRAAEKGIKKVVFDRNGFLYHGRVKAISEGARKAGLDF